MSVRSPRLPFQIYDIRLRFKTFTCSALTVTHNGTDVSCPTHFGRSSVHPVLHYVASPFA